jgi:hypothetical protein
VIPASVTDIEQVTGINYSIPICRNTLFLEAIPKVEEWLFRIVREAIMLHPFYDLNRVINGHIERTPFFVAPATVIGKVHLSSLY